MKRSKGKTMKGKSDSTSPHPNEHDLDLISAHFGLSPNLCAHDLILGLGHKINTLVQDARNELWKSLGEEQPCGHPRACTIPRRGRSVNAPVTCVACSAALHSKLSVFEDVLDEFREDPDATARIKRLKTHHGALTWEDEV